ncbi:trypsin [Drosophila willistoni]|uniref:trypsin n=1 Tax=Drosophila willistoni TaxID=7260 RepID=UPI001F07F7E8|nr:trypsin [Drosophila willistoni]
MGKSLIFSLFMQLILSVCLGAEGHRQYIIHPKVVGGYPVTIEEIPYQVSIRYREIHEGSGHVCGGSVISQRAVLSAAHCFVIKTQESVRYREANLYIVVAGGDQINQADQNTLEYSVQEIIGHPDYNKTTLENDIAMLFINGYIPWQSRTVRAVSLAEMPPPEGQICLVSGWGKINKTNETTRLQQAPVPVLNNRTCAAIYLVIAISQMCAGYLQGGIDACKGDSGGPLICSDQLSGIVSWGVGCADAGYPGVYTNVSYYIDWIRATNASFDYSVYLDMRNSDVQRLRNCNLLLINLVPMLAYLSTLVLY